MLEWTCRPRLRIDRKRKPIGTGKMSKKAQERVETRMKIVKWFSILHSIFDNTYATVFSGDDEDEDNSTQGVIARSPPNIQTINEVLETQ